MEEYQVGDIVIITRDCVFYGRIGVICKITPSPWSDQNHYLVEYDDGNTNPHCASEFEFVRHDSSYKPKPFTPSPGENYDNNDGAHHRCILCGEIILHPKRSNLGMFQIRCDPCVGEIIRSGKMDGYDEYELRFVV